LKLGLNYRSKRNVYKAYSNPLNHLNGPQANSPCPKRENFLQILRLLVVDLVGVTLAGKLKHPHYCFKILW